MAPEGRGYWFLACPDLGPAEPYLYALGDRPGRPDPASRFQSNGVHGPSSAWDHEAFRWTDAAWKGLPLGEMVIYELHIGTFTPEGTFDGAIGKLDYLKDLGVNCLEVMPVGQFPGQRGWGYDVAYPFAVQASYGGPDGFKRLVDACHAKGLAILLDVVYNHLGPEGNYLGEYGPYFTDAYRTPWGRALNLDGPDSGPVRDYFIANALYWLRDYHLDGLRLDAIHQIHDESATPFLADLTREVEDFSRRDGRVRWLVAESDLNDTRVVRERAAGGFALAAQWLDDFHHCVDAMLHKDRSDYRDDYGGPYQLVKAYREGYVYSGEWCPTRRRRFGRSSADRPGREFVVFIQNHDQVGNRLTGERISVLSSFEANKLAAAAMLVSPYIPLLFMGEEYGETNPFLFFADYGDAGLREAVREGRKREFGFLAASGETPDPMDESTFRASRLDWDKPGRDRHRPHLEWYKALLALRRAVPALRRPDKDNLEVTGLDRVFFLRRGESGVAGASTSEAAVLLNFNAHAAEARLQVSGQEGTWVLALDSADSRWGGPGSAAPAEAGPRDAICLLPYSAVIYTLRPR